MSALSRRRTPDLQPTSRVVHRPPGRRLITPVRAAVALLMIAAGTFVLLWFEPQQLFIDDRVSDPVPTVASSSTVPTSAGDTTSSTSAPEPIELLRGEFASRDHGTAGAVRLLELTDGSRVLRIEDLDTDNGPDLYVYLSTNPADGGEGTFDDDYLSLGRLKGNLGDQNYEVPADADLERYRSVVIWCDRFNSAFGAADLT